MLFIADVLYDPSTKPDDIISAMDGVIEPLRTKPVDQKTLDRALVKARSDLYDTFGTQGGFGLMDILASFALFDDDPGKVNTLATAAGKSDARTVAENGGRIFAAGKSDGARCGAESGSGRAGSGSEAVKISHARLLDESSSNTSDRTQRRGGLDV